MTGVGVRELVVSVNVGTPREVRVGERVVRAGILKEPAPGPVVLNRGGFAGDVQVNRRVHGGPEMAAYLYSADDYGWWEEELQRPLPPGTFGENLTVTGMRDRDVAVGDRFRIGGALVEATSPREPCATFAARMGGDPGWVARFLAADRMGFYVRVLEPGQVEAGDSVERVGHGPGGLTIAEIHRLYTRGRDDLDGLRRAAAGAERLKDTWREWLRERITTLESAVTPPS